VIVVAWGGTLLLLGALAPGMDDAVSMAIGLGVALLATWSAEAAASRWTGARRTYG